MDHDERPAATAGLWLPATTGASQCALDEPGRPNPRNADRYAKWFAHCHRGRDDPHNGISADKRCEWLRERRPDWWGLHATRLHLPSVVEHGKLRGGGMRGRSPRLSP